MRLVVCALACACDCLHVVCLPCVYLDLVHAWFLQTLCFGVFFPFCIALVGILDRYMLVVAQLVFGCSFRPQHALRDVWSCRCALILGLALAAGHHDVL